MNVFGDFQGHMTWCLPVSFSRCHFEYWEGTGDEVREEGSGCAWTKVWHEAWLGGGGAFALTDPKELKRGPQREDGLFLLKVKGKGQVSTLDPSLMWEARNASKNLQPYCLLTWILHINPKKFPWVPEVFLHGWKASSTQRLENCQANKHYVENFSSYWRGN